MKLNRWVLHFTLIVLLLGFFGLESCTGAKFKDSCLESMKILENAKKRLKVTHFENIAAEGKIESTVVRFDNTKAKTYLSSNDDKLNMYYETIKGHFEKPGEKFDDSLFMLAFMNEMTHWLCGKAIEDRCKYLSMIRKIDKISLSEWMMDEVFAPFINTEDTIKEWLDMDINRKYKDIYDLLMVPERKEQW